MNYFYFQKGLFFFTYLKSCKLHQMVDNLDTNSGTRLFLQGRDESSRREKRNKDDLMENKKRNRILENGN